MVQVWFLVVLLLAGICESARILALLPLFARSHWIVMEPLLQELASRGHQLTVVSPFPQKSPLPNYTDIDVSHHCKPPFAASFPVDAFKEKMPNAWKSSTFIYEFGKYICECMNEPQLQNLMKSNNRFDLVITELFASDCFAYYAYKLKLPLIFLSTCSSLPWASDRFGLPDNPSYIPNMLVSFPSRMSLLERTYNFLVLMYAKFWHLHVFSEQSRSVAEKYFGEPLPPLKEVVVNSSLLLVNSYFALTQSRPLPPNIVEVGGIHIRDKKPLPQDLKDVLDSAKNGVIILSFGSVVQFSTLSKSTIAMFLKVFSKIPQTVVLKYEAEILDAPPNVITRKWLPQRDLLEDERVVALIAHGGLASTQEAVYFGKPLLGVPFFTDQFANVRAVVERGAGLQLDIDTLTEPELAAAVSEITNNPSYKDSMRRLSMQYRDRPMTALQTAIYRTEYVIRHQGAPHLRPASVHLPLHSYLLLDVAALLLASLTALVYTLYWVLKWTLARVTRASINQRDKTD